MALSSLGNASAALRPVSVAHAEDASSSRHEVLRPSGVGTQHSPATTSATLLHSHAPGWILTYHRSAPAALLGMRSGHLVPTSGALLARANFSKPGDVKALLAVNKSSSKATARLAIDEASEGASDIKGLGGLLSEVGAGKIAGVGGGAGFGSGEHSDGHADSGGRQSEAAQALNSSPDAPAGVRAGAEEGVHALLTADNLHKLDKEASYWTTSIRLAMECAVAHPGADLFVQAFTLVDAEGNLISSFRKQARLRADAKGKVVVSAHRTESDESGKQAVRVHDESLLGELSAAPLMMLSLRATVDEAGNAVAAFADAAKAEYVHLLRLFNRPLLAGYARSLKQDEGELKALWAGVCMHPQIFEKLPLFGDALRRELVQARVEPSETISQHSAHSYRAHQNWLRTNDVVERWATDKKPLDAAGLKQINAMLGEGLKPWNKAAQADHVGARYGEFRTVDVVSGVPPSYYLRAERVTQALRELFRWLEGQSINAASVVLIAAQFYQRLVSIHPFSDGNGRTARLMLDWLLQMHGWPPVLLQGNAALFPNGADGLAPGAVEKALIEGIRKTIRIHTDALRLDEQPA
jgi:prophage maintenance system killer protein